MNKRHEDRGDEHGLVRLVDRVAAQRGPGVELADRLRGQGGRQAAGVEHVHQVVDLLLREAAGDFAAIGDRALDGRGRIQLAVEDDAQPAARSSIHRIGQVLAGEVREQLPALAIEVELHARPAGLVGAGRGLLQVVAGHVVRSSFTTSTCQNVLAVLLVGADGEFWSPWKRAASFSIDGHPPGQHRLALQHRSLGSAWSFGVFSGPGR